MLDIIKVDNELYVRARSALADSQTWALMDADLFAVLKGCAITENVNESKQLAFSYIRFSSQQRAEGDSLRRQTELAERYAHQHGMQLDVGLTLRDLGISAFKGRNRTEGALAGFLEACKSGRVPRGSALLVESLDRLSREEVEEALFRFLEIIRSGIEIHTLADNCVYRRGAIKAEQLMLSLFVMSRANEESQRKSDRVRAAWSQKKKSISERPGIAVSGNAPAWIKAVKGQPMELIEDRATVIRDIFKMCIDGSGAPVITQHLNANRKPFNGQPDWCESYVERILSSPAAYGGFQPMKRDGERKVKDGKLVLNYFPAAIDYATWLAAKEARASRLYKRSGRGDAVHCVLSGLIEDVQQARPMHFYWKGKELVTDSYRLGLKPNRINYDLFERAFLSFLNELEWASVLEINESDEMQGTEREIALLVAEVAQVEQQVKSITDAFILAPTSKALADRMTAAELKLEADKSKLAALKSSLQSLRNRHHEFLDENVAWAQLAEAKDAETRTRLRNEIRRKVSKIDVDFSAFELPEIGAIKCVASVEFATGAKRALVFAETGEVRLSNKPVTADSDPSTMRTVGWAE